MSEEDPQNVLERAVERARAQQASIADVFGRLASASAPDRSLETSLKTLQGQRDEALRAVGEALLNVLAEGATLEDVATPTTPTKRTPSSIRRRKDKPAPTDKPPPDDDTGDTVYSPSQPRVERRQRRRSVDTTEHSVGYSTLPPDPDSLKTLAESFGHNQPELSAVDSLAEIRSFMDQVGDAESPSTPLEFLDGIQRLARVSDRTDRWKRLPRRVQQLLLAYCTCKSRVWQENLDLGSSRHEVVLEQIFRALTRYSARERPGFVHGLSRSHRSERDSWAEDARYWWTELCMAARIEPEPSNTERQLDELFRTLDGNASDGVVQAAVVHAIDNGVPSDDVRLLKMVGDHSEALQDEPRLKDVRKALRDHNVVPPADGPTNTSIPIGADWPFTHVTQGRTAIIAGGDARPEATERVRIAFGFKTVTWHADPADNRLASLAKRIRGGSIDLVFFLARFSSHAAQTALRDACKEAGVPFVRIEHGYGVSQLKLAIENWMHGKP